MKTLTLVVDERELSTIQAALLLLQEQVDALPEDLAEMIRKHGQPMAEAEIDQLSQRLNDLHDLTHHPFDGEPPRFETLVEIERSSRVALAKR